MKTPILLSLALLLTAGSLLAQDTFSICAVDPETGEVGSAGASCIDTDDCGGCGGVIIISGLIPGKGAVNSQATACIPNVNLNNALTQMEAGLSPQQIVDYLLGNDACQFGNTSNRQYGIVDLDDNGDPRSAAYTGFNCLDYKNHLTGANYAIQGNILLGQQILDSIEQRFLNAEGPLAVRLMAALQGANVPGADSRCLDDGISSKSSYLRVARPEDTLGTLYLELNVPSVLPGVDPIDSLQSLFDEWLQTVDNEDIYVHSTLVKVYPNPVKDILVVEWLDASVALPASAQLFSADGRLLLQLPMSPERTELDLQPLAAGNIYLLKVMNENGQLLHSQKIIR